MLTLPVILALPCDRIVAHTAVSIVLMLGCRPDCLANDHHTMNSEKTPLILIFAALGLLAGCTSQPASTLVSAPPPPAPTTPQGLVVTQQPQHVIVTPQTQQVVTTVPSGTSYVVMQAPPAPQAPQAIPERPSTQHVWIDGYWTWRNNRYEWMAGHWEVPPFTGAKWVNPRVQSEGGSFRFYEGSWN
jgi:hypothetical protein